MIYIYWGTWNHSLNFLVALVPGEKKRLHSKLIPGNRPLVKQKHSPVSSVRSHRTPLQLWKKLMAVNCICTAWYPKHHREASSKGTIGIFFSIRGMPCSIGMIPWSCVISKIGTRSWPIRPVHFGSTINTIHPTALSFMWSSKTNCLTGFWVKIIWPVWPFKLSCPRNRMIRS